MANIGIMPSAADLIASSESHDGYGDHLRWEREGGDKVHLLILDSNVVVATASIHAAYVHLDELTPLVVPYVNAFITHTNQRVEKYWRTKSYRILPVEGNRPAVDPLAANTRAAQALGLLAPRQQSESERMREFGNLLIRAAECLEREERERLSAESAKLREESRMTKA